jgi:thermitase
MHNTLNPGFDMRMPEAWNICRGSGDVRVAVIDLGVQCNHPDFGGQEFRNVKFPDGYDFVDHLDPPYPNSNESHGTACAGIITAISDNDELGIASIGGGDGTIDGGIPVVPVRVASYDNRVDAIGWTGERVNTGIRVANMSWDIADGPSLRAAVSDAWHNGLAMVAAAGQAPLPPTDPVFPSCYHHAVVRVGGVYRTVKW